MPLLRADDAARRLRAPWLGPDPSIRLPVDWTQPEWAVFTVVGLTAWVALGAGGWFLFGALGTEKFGQLTLTLVLAVPTGPWAAWTAKERVAPILDSDRTLGWLVSGWIAAARMLWWAHGPIDRVLWAGAGAVWLFLAPFLALLPGPTIVWLAASGYVCVRVGRRVRDRVESPDRLRRRTWARLERAAGPVAWALGVPVEVPVRLDACIPRGRYRLAARFRFIFDVLRARGAFA